MSKFNRKPTDVLLAFSPLSKAVSKQSWALVLCSVGSSFSLWAWFYLSSVWVDHWLMSSSAEPYPFYFVLMAITLFVVFRMMHIIIRATQAKKIAHIFHQKLFSELLDKRWALIRTKANTAWQDVTFRHLPIIEQYILDYQTQIKQVVLMPLFVLVTVFPLSWLAAFILLFTLPLLPLFMWMVGVGAATIQKKHIKVLDQLGSFFSDRIQGQSTVRLLNQTATQMNRFEIAGIELNKRLADVIKMAFLSSSVIDFFSTVSMAVLAVFIGFSLLGEIKIGFWGHPATLQDGLFILLIAPSFFSELKNLGRLYHVKAEAVATAYEWQTVLKSNTVLKPAPNASFTELYFAAGSILGFEGITLLTVEKLALTYGETVKISGRSGVGKTILLDALAGLRTIKNSKILLNSQTVNSFDQLTPLIFYLNQTPVIFNGTIRENIGLGRFGDADIENSLVRVGLGNWLTSQPKKLQTELGDFPALSGGQKQRFALARLFLFDLPIVFLDEPIAHLSESEQTDILALLVELTTNKTSLWISHKNLTGVHFSKTWSITDDGFVRETCS